MPSLCPLWSSPGKGRVSGERGPRLHLTGGQLRLQGALPRSCLGKELPWGAEGAALGKQLVLLVGDTLTRGVHQQVPDWLREEYYSETLTPSLI